MNKKDERTLAISKSNELDPLRGRSGAGHEDVAPGLYPDVSVSQDLRRDLVSSKLEKHYETLTEKAKALCDRLSGVAPLQKDKADGNAAVQWPEATELAPQTLLQREMQM